MKTLIIAPSILSADFSDFKTAVQIIENSGADMVHVDIMDGHFVPEITFGRQTVADLRDKTNLPLDVHLMVENPENFIKGFADAGADYITIHQEAGGDVKSTLQLINKLGIKSGISIRPETQIDDIKDILDLVNIVLIMGVNPGYGGQSMFEQTPERINTLKKLRDKNNLKFLISVDGGVNKETIPSVVEAGTDILVTGSYFFKTEKKHKLVDNLHNI